MADTEATTPIVSILILARDAADCIEATIASLHPCNGEIIVYDTGSQDGTPAIAAEAGAKVIRGEWKDDFAAARNAALKHATAPWILWVDAGETLLRSDALELREFLETTADPATAYQLFVCIPAEGGQGPGEQIARVRLHPRREEIQFVGRVRESLLPALAESELSLDRLELRLYRGPREHEPAVKEARARRNIALAETVIAEVKPSADMWNCLGEAYQNLSQAAESAACYRQARQLAEPKSAEELEALYGLLTSLDTLETDRQAQLTLSMEALERYPLDSQLLCAMGGYLQALGQEELASRSYEVAFRHGMTEPTVWHLPNIMELAASCRVSLLLPRNESKAFTAAEEGLKECPDSPRLQRQMLDLLVRRGAKDKALAIVKTMRVQPLLREALETTVHGACLAVNQSWIPARAYLQTALKAGLSDALCYRWLVITHLGLGADHEARAVMDAWEAFDPRNPEIQAFRQDPRLAGESHHQTPTLRRIDPTPVASNNRPQSRVSTAKRA